MYFLDFPNLNSTYDMDIVTKQVKYSPYDKYVLHESNWIIHRLSIGAHGEYSRNKFTDMNVQNVALNNNQIQY